MQDEHARSVVVDDRDVERIRHRHLTVAAGDVLEGKARRIVGDDRPRVGFGAGRRTGRRGDRKREVEGTHALDRHQAGAVIGRGLRITVVGRRVAVVRGYANGIAASRNLRFQGVQDVLQRFACGDLMGGAGDPAACAQPQRPDLARHGCAREIQSAAVRAGTDGEIPTRTLDDRKRHRGGGGDGENRKLEHQFREVGGALHARATGLHGAADREVVRLRCRIGQPHAGRERRAVGGEYDETGVAGRAGDLAAALQVGAGNRQLDREGSVVVPLEVELAVADRVGSIEAIA